MQCRRRPDPLLAALFFLLWPGRCCRPHNGPSLFKADRETDGLASNAFGAERNVRLIGINIDEDREGIFEGFLHLDEVCKCFPGRLPCRAPLQLHCDSVAFLSTLRDTPLERNMND